MSIHHGNITNTTLVKDVEKIHSLDVGIGSTDVILQG
jgi:hypothetical protein